MKGREDLRLAGAMAGLTVGEPHAKWLREKKFDVLCSDDSYHSIDQSSCTNKFMNLTLTEKKNDKSIIIPVSNSCLTD